MGRNCQAMCGASLAGAVLLVASCAPEKHSSPEPAGATVGTRSDGGADDSVAPATRRGESVVKPGLYRVVVVLAKGPALGPTTRSLRPATPGAPATRGSPLAQLALKERITLRPMFP